MRNNKPLSNLKGHQVVSISGSGQRSRKLSLEIKIATSKFTSLTRVIDATTLCSC